MRESKGKGAKVPKAVLKVFVGGLSKRWVEPDVATFMKQFGELTELRIIMGEDGYSKGFGFATLMTSLSPQAVYGEYEFMNRRVEIKPITPQKFLFLFDVDLKATPSEDISGYFNSQGRPVQDLEFKHHSAKEQVTVKVWFVEPMKTSQAAQGVIKVNGVAIHYSTSSHYEPGRRPYNATGQNSQRGGHRAEQGLGAGKLPASHRGLPVAEAENTDRAAQLQPKEVDLEPPLNMKEISEVQVKRKLSYKKNAGTDFFPNRSQMHQPTAGLIANHSHPHPVEQQQFDNGRYYPHYLPNYPLIVPNSQPFSGHYGYCITTYTQLNYSLTGQVESLVIEFFTLPGRE